MIYLDNAATKAVSRYALESMVPYYTNSYANPSSSYGIAKECKKAIETSREIIAHILKSSPEEIYFTSGGTESDNWAIKMAGRTKERKRIISSKIEHPAVLKSLEYMENKGYDVKYADILPNGMVDIRDIYRLSNANTSLITCMMANNETGVIQPIEEIGHIARKCGAIFHTDAVQAFCHKDINVKKMNIDMLSASAHKFGGPKGVGFLYIRKDIDISPFIHGGSQERDMRAGTSNVAGIVGMAAAAKESYMNMNRWNNTMRKLRDYTIKRMIDEIPDVKINGDMKYRLDNNINISIVGINGYVLIEMLDIDGICVSGTSACKADSKEISHVLMAMGVPVDIAKGTIRITLSETNTKDEIDKVINTIKKNVEELRKII